VFSIQCLVVIFQRNSCPTRTLLLECLDNVDRSGFLHFPHFLVGNSFRAMETAFTCPFLRRSANFLPDLHLFQSSDTAPNMRIFLGTTLFDSIFSSLAFTTARVGVPCFLFLPERIFFKPPRLTFSSVLCRLRYFFMYNPSLDGRLSGHPPPQSACFLPVSESFLLPYLRPLSFSGG